MEQKLKILFLLFILSSSLSAQILNDSNLPIIIINTDGGVEISFGRVLGSMKIIYRGEGQRTFVSDQNNNAYLNYDGRIDIKIRGNSTLLDPKSQYGFTTRKADNITNNNVSLLGMPAENDWILNGMSCDIAYIRDYLAYNLSRQIGEYASSAVYCELIINGEYKGLYLLAEKIKADDNRVNIIKIGINDTCMPKLSGGYITVAEEREPIPIAWTMESWDGQLVNYFHEFPKPDEIKPSQHDYIYNQFLSLENTVKAGNASTLNGFPSIIDIPSFLHFIIINELASNPDVYWGSTYFHKDRNGKLRAGPIWDFDFAFGNYSNRSKTNVWQFSGCDSVSMSDNGGSRFWKGLFDNTQFRCYLSKRWNELIQPGQPLNLLSIETFIDQTVTTISEAVERDSALWGHTSTHQQHITDIKAFLAERIPWITAGVGPCSSCTDLFIPPLVITKIMYHPEASIYSTDNEDLEFIEITNNGDDTVDLNGVYFGGTGFVYQFPINSVLGPHISVFLASNSRCFQLMYGFVPYGQFTRHLSNKSENLVLLDAFGNILDNVNYSDFFPWPNADGNGYYLVLRNTDLDNSNAGNWANSNNLMINASQPDTCNYANILIDAQVTQPLCFGRSDGSINITVSGNYPGFSYKWSTGSKDEDLTRLTEGIYKVTVTDSEGCSNSKHIQVFNPSPITITENKINPLCHGDSSGSIKLKISGGSNPYTCLWECGASNDSIDGLTAGCYYVEITDSNGCTEEKSICVSEPEPINLILTKKDNLCFGDSTGIIFISAMGGTPGYQFRWLDEVAQKLNGSLKAGLYIISVIDENYCTAIDSIVLVDPAKITIGEIVGNNTVKEFLPYTYSVADQENFIFQWIVEGGNVISGQGTNGVEVQWGSSEKGVVKLVAESDLGCYSNTVKMDVSISSTGLTEYEENVVSVYPNPVNDILTITFKNRGQYKVGATSVNGQVLYNKKINALHCHIDLSSFQKGIYFITIISEDHAIIRKIIKL
jgi:hypothetical protein